MNHCLCAFVIHHQDDKVCGLSACLQSEASAAGLHHDWSTPFAGEVLAATASHQSAAVLCSDDETGLFDRRQHDHTLCLVQQVEWHSVWSVEQIFQYIA